MSQITQIVESNNGKLLGLFISESDVDSIEVTMKISLGAINEIVQTFRRYNYEIISRRQLYQQFKRTLRLLRQIP
jgi:hypothetical protein